MTKEPHSTVIEHQASSRQIEECTNPAKKSSPVTESQHLVTDEPNNSSLPSSPAVESQHPAVDEQIMEYVNPIISIEDQTITAPISRQNIPSSSNNEYFDISLALNNLQRGHTNTPPNAMGNPQESNKDGSEALLHQILSRLSMIPTTDEMTDLTVNMAKDIEENLEANSLALHQRFNNMIETVNLFPENLGTKLTKRSR